MRQILRAALGADNTQLALGEVTRAKLRPPIIVDAKSEILLYRTVDDVVSDLEAIDVRNGEYPAAYDSEGRRIAVRTKRIQRRIFWGLMKAAVEVPDLEPLEGDPHHASELTQLLRRYVEGEDPSRPSERSLRELVEAAVARLGYAFPSS